MSSDAGRMIGLGAVALVVGGGVLGASVIRAVSTPAPEVVAVPIEVVEGGSDVVVSESELGDRADRIALGDRPASGAISSAGAGTPESALAQAVENDLFRPERAPLNQRYQLPSERVEVREPEERERPSFPDLRVHGTALSGDDGIALIRLEDRDEDDALPPRVLALGEAIAGYSLLSVTDDTATLIGPGGTMIIPVTALPTPRRSTRNSRDSRNSESNTERELEETRAQLQQLMQQIGGRATGRGGRGGGVVELRARVGTFGQTGRGGGGL